MPQRATISDVARAAGVSKTTVSVALSGKGRVGGETRKRVLEVATAFGWHPSQQARGLSESRAYAVGIIFARDVTVLGADPFFAPFIAGLEQQLGLQGYMLCLQIDTSGNEQHELALYRRLAAEGRVDGVILTDVRVNDPRMRLLAEVGLPFVSLGSPIKLSNGAVVRNDEEDAVQISLGHLAALGHREVVFVSGPESFYHARTSRNAFMRMAPMLGIQPELFESDFTPATGLTATREILGRSERPQAFIFANSLMAVAAMKEMRDQAVRIPEDVSVMSLSDHPLADWLSPTLTSISSDSIELGRLCVDQLMCLLGQESAPDDIVVRNPLIERGSTGRVLIGS